MEMKMLIDAKGARKGKPDPSLIKLLVKAQKLKEAIVQGGDRLDQGSKYHDSQHRFTLPLFRKVRVRGSSVPKRSRAAANAHWAIANPNNVAENEPLTTGGGWSGDQWADPQPIRQPVIGQ